MPCSGDTTQLCGAGAQVDLYLNSAYTPPTPPSSQTNIGSYVYKGW